VLLVGGSTRMPMIQAFVRARLGHRPMKGIDVDQAVALGAAIVATEQQDRRTGQAARPRYGLPAPVRMIDVTNHSLGMIALNAEGSAYVNAIILPDEAGLLTDLSRLVETFESVAQIITRGGGIAPSLTGDGSGTGLGALLGKLGRGR
jgi:molecular chaperone DnaK (HSP70)